MVFYMLPQKLVTHNPRHELWLYTHEAWGGYIENQALVQTNNHARDILYIYSHPGVLIETS